MAIKTLAVSDELYRYMTQVSLRETDVMKRLRDETYTMPSLDLQSAPEQSQLMAFFLKVLGAKRVIEIGVYTGYSTLVMASALPEDGKIVACDMNEEWTSVGRRYWEEAGVADKIDLHLGPALETLDELIADPSQHGAYDFAYIDADKDNNPNYIERCYKLLRHGGVIAIDNIFAEDRIHKPELTGGSLATVRKMNQDLLIDDRFDLTLIPIGDGMTFLRKR
jgi:predicted O-methyltransferase YrrM